MVKKCYLKLSRISKTRYSALGQEVQFDSEHKPCSVYVTPYISNTVCKLHFQDVRLNKHTKGEYSYERQETSLILNFLS